MKSIPYSELNKKQLAQVGYFFADKHFGTASNTYLYEVDGNGDVKGRVSAKPAKSKHAGIHPKIKITCSAVPSEFVTEAMIQHVRMNMDALATSIAVKIYQQQQSIK